MHPATIAKRQLDALNKVTDSMTLLAERFGVNLPAPVMHRDPTIGQMMRWEAVAGFMESLCFAELPEVVTPDARSLIQTLVSLEDVLAIDGLPKAAIAKITEAFNET
jgi:hypothetical protein